MKSGVLKRIGAGMFAVMMLGMGSVSYGEERDMVSQQRENLENVHFTLDNGLNVYLLRDNALPIVTVNLWVNVGSKDERAGRTGFAHLFEHLMFMGTESVPDIDMILERGGGSNNASTREDVTNYYTVGPENMLETILYIESDRLCHLPEAMTQEKLDRQRDVVLNERRQTLENQPYGKLWLALPSAIYPETHPYSHPVIGSVEDITAATVDDVISFFNTYYVPSNMTLVLGGDIEPTRARALVEKYFSRIPGRVKPEGTEVPRETYPRERRVRIEDNVQTARLTMVWHSPSFMQDGDAELDILSNILCKGKNSRLVNRLVYEKSLASNVSCGQMSGLASMFMIDALPLPGVSVETLEDEILSELNAIVRDGISEEEFNRTKNSIETAFVKQLQSIEARADSFNSHVYYAHSTDFPSGDLERYRRASVSGLMRVAGELFTDDSRRCTLVVDPKIGDRKDEAR